MINKKLMNLTKQQLVVVAGGIGILIILVLVIAGVIPGLRSKPDATDQTKGELAVWLFGESQEYFDTVTPGFIARYPKITFSFRTFTDLSRYESALLDALASGAGPDIFMIENGSLFKYLNKIAPAPITIASASFVKSQFPNTVSTDFILNNLVYGLPLSIDTLSLLYNERLLHEAGVVFPPSTWGEFVTAVKKITQTDTVQRVTRSAAAIGTGSNISEASDLLSLILLQNGVLFTGEDSAQTLLSDTAIDSLTFYTQFSNPQSDFYTWNYSFVSDVDAFAKERVAMIFGYNRTLDELKSVSPFTSVKASPVPQQDGENHPVSYPEYWGFVVSRQSLYQAVAWDFLTYLTLSNSNALSYVVATGKPPALLSAINEYIDDEILGIFARQTLIAQSWTRVDALAVSRLVIDAIDNVVQGALNPSSALQGLEASISELVKQRNVVR